MKTGRATPSFDASTSLDVLGLAATDGTADARCGVACVLARAGRCPLGVVIAPWLLDLGRTDTLICSLGALALWTAGELELRLKTIQVRLAGMSDDLNALTADFPIKVPMMT